MAKKEYTDTFKKEAVTLVLSGGYSVQTVTAQLDIPTGTFSKWMAKARREATEAADCAHVDVSPRVTSLKKDIASCSLCDDSGLVLMTTMHGAYWGRCEEGHVVEEKV